VGLRQEYINLIGKELIEEFEEESEKFGNRSILMVSSFKKSKGVEVLVGDLKELFSEFKIKIDFKILIGDKKFYDVVDNLLIGIQNENYNKENINEYLKFFNERIITYNYELLSELDKYDMIIVHDLHSFGLISFKKWNKWIWHAHLDLTRPDRDLWGFITNLSENYDKVIVSANSYKLNDKWVVLPPGLNPFSLKNKEIEKIDEILLKNNIPVNKPLVVQVSRMDRNKDPFAIFEIFEIAMDFGGDFNFVYKTILPEENNLLKDFLKKIERCRYREHFFINCSNDDILINALQRKAVCVIQESKREGFSLSISEALWKRTPVISTGVGGIPLQVRDGYNGFLVNTEYKSHYRKIAEAIIYLLENKDKAKEMGINGRNLIKENYLMILHGLDYIKIINSLVH